jgi:hypothetical protein
MVKESFSNYIFSDYNIIYDLTCHNQKYCINLINSLYNDNIRNNVKIILWEFILILIKLIYNKIYRTRIYKRYL